MEGGEKVFLFVLEHVLLPLLVGLVLALFSHWLDKR
ncbi:type I toxin-antitoxin system Fst family toxin [Enterococcus hirae]